jgi:Tol biopolymer transport system component/DNA-binding winged helix-turn-helix (wHTH) protein
MRPKKSQIELQIFPNVSKSMNNGETKSTIRFAEFELDPAHRRLTREGEQVVLNPKAFDLLVFLAKNTGRVVTKNEILDRVWDGQFVEEANLTVQMSALRKALGEKKESPRFLVTIPGRGYEFIADSHNDDNEIVIEKHKFSRLVVEEEIESEGRDGGEATEPNRNASHTTSSPLLNYSLSQNLTIIAIVAILALGIGGAWVMSGNRGSLAADHAEREPKIRKLTNNGKVASTVLSPGGKFFAYAVYDKPNWETSIHLGQIDGGGDVVLRPAAEVVYRVTAFSADGGWLYYTAAEPRSFTKAVLYKMPVLGGVPQKLASGVSAYAVLSPDEAQIAYVRNDKQAKTSTLIVSRADGGDEHTLAVRPFERSFVPGSVSWSADGELIALSAANEFNENDDTNQGYEIFTVSTDDGRISQLTNLGWSDINRVEWLRDGTALAVTGRKKDQGSSVPPRRSLWLVDYPDGNARKITVDLNSYAGSVSLTPDGKSILVVQGQAESNIWIAPADDLQAARQITFGSAGQNNGWYGVDWTPDGKIIYSAWIGENSTIWQMDASGSNSKQLTPIGFRDEQPTVTADGSVIVFQSNRSGKSELWRMSPEGDDLRQLTNSENISSEPNVTLDGNWIYYMNDHGGETSVWRVSVNGGQSAEVIGTGSSDPRVSPDGKYVACGYAKDGKTSLAILPIDGGQPVKLFDLPKTSNLHNSVRWTADGKFITYRDWANGLWKQNVDGGEPQRLAGLPEEKLMTYAWSRDGKQLAFTRGKESLDVVLITDFR